MTPPTHSQAVEAAVQRLMGHIEKACLIKDGEQPELEQLIVDLIQASRAELTRPQVAAPVTDEQIEQAARYEFNGGLDWTNEGNLLASAVQRAYFRFGAKWALAASRAPEVVRAEPAQPSALGSLAERRIFDAIRSAYDMGYTDARNIRTVPGDSAPGYKGREIEVDHGGALLRSLNQTTAQPAQPKDPVTEDAFPALHALVEALLTRADAAMMQRLIAEGVRIMGTRGWTTPVPFDATPPSGAGGDVGAMPSNQDLAAGAFYPQVTGYATHPLVVGAGGEVGAGKCYCDHHEHCSVCQPSLWWQKSITATPAAEQGSGDWGIDTSTGTPILIYKNCSVIESEQARYVLRLIAAEQGDAKP